MQGSDQKRTTSGNSMKLTSCNGRSYTQQRYSDTDCVNVIDINGNDLTQEVWQSMGTQCSYKAASPQSDTSITWSSTQAEACVAGGGKDCTADTDCGTGVTCD